MNSLSSKSFLKSKTIRWAGIVAILGLVLAACSPVTGTPSGSSTQGVGGTETPGASTTGTAEGTTSPNGTAAATTAATAAATAASTTAATTAPTTAATTAPTTAATSAATSAATATVGSGSSSGSSSGLAVNVAKTNAQVYILTDSKGMTLYWFLKDTANTSTCDASCLAKWTPFLASGSASSSGSGSSSGSSAQVQVTVPQGSGLNASDFGTAQTTDGKTIVTYRGFPLYYFSGDKNPGDTNGYGVAGLWVVVAVPAPNNATPGTTPTP